MIDLITTEKVTYTTPPDAAALGALRRLEALWAIEEPSEEQMAEMDQLEDHLPTVREVRLMLRSATALDAAKYEGRRARMVEWFEAETGRPVNVKKGQFLAPWDMANVVAKLNGTGNPDGMVTDRGTSFGYNTLVSDMRALPIMARETGAPIVFDATHSVQSPGGQGGSSGGDRTMVPYLARAAVATGVAGVFIETHDDPDNTTSSDGPNMVRLSDMAGLLEQLMAIDAIVKG